jgi:hypothetical protein
MVFGKHLILMVQVTPPLLEKKDHEAAMVLGRGADEFGISESPSW